MLNNLNIEELDNYINTIFDLETPIKDKQIAALEFELQLEALAKPETGSLQYAGLAFRTR